MKIRENVNISELTTMRLGGPAKYVIDIENEDEVRGAYTFAREKSLPVYVLGSGANTIGHDEGFPGVIIRNCIKGVEIAALKTPAGDIELNEDIPLDEELTESLNTLNNEDTIWYAAGGEVWDDFVVRVSADGYTGVETLAAIPGTVAAAPVQNIGAYGSEIAQTVFAVSVFDTMDNEYKTLFPDELDFSYRHSIFNTTWAGRYFIISVFFKLRKGSLVSDGATPNFYTSLQAYLEENNITDYSPASIAAAVTAVRDGKLPDPAVIASSGSFFKNIHLSDKEADAAEKKGIPVYRTPGKNKVNTGWLVEHSGLKGKDLHGFKICDTAALVLINDHATSYADLEAARSEIRAAVKEKFGLDIEQEPVEIPTDPSGGNND